MKVVLFCGGLGMRLREYSQTIPKPMVPVGHRPILWHVMRYYAHFGHTEFVLCLGWQGDVIKNYFLNYDECASNDFVLDGRGKVELLGSDIQDWKITFVDTGRNSNIGERLKAVQNHLQDEEMFLANYSDGVSDVPLPKMIQYAIQTESIATCIGVRPKQSFHVVDADDKGYVSGLTTLCDSPLRMNGGFFVFRNEIFDYMQDGEELVLEPFQRLMRIKKLTMYRYDGFWGCMDTFKEKQHLDELFHSGLPPWEVWKKPQIRPELIPSSLFPANVTQTQVSK